MLRREISRKKIAENKGNCQGGGGIKTREDRCQGNTPGFSSKKEGGDIVRKRVQLKTGPGLLKKDLREKLLRARKRMFLN